MKIARSVYHCICTAAALLLAVSLAAQAIYKLRDIVLFFKDRAPQPIHRLDIVLSGLRAGSYRLRAALQSPSGRALALSAEVSFSLRAGTEQ